MTKFNPYDASNTSETVEQEIKRRKDNTPDELATLRARIADLEAAGERDTGRLLAHVMGWQHVTPYEARQIYAKWQKAKVE